MWTLRASLACQATDEQQEFYILLLGVFRYETTVAQRKDKTIGTLMSFPYKLQITYGIIQY